jgi:hypothetical protein
MTNSFQQHIYTFIYNYFEAKIKFQRCFFWKLLKKVFVLLKYFFEKITKIKEKIKKNKEK